MKRGTLLSLFVSGCLALFFLPGCLGERAEEREAGERLAAGDRIVKIVFDTLRNELMGAMRTKGVAGAIDYCRIHAGQLTAVYEQGDIVSVRRAATRYRNPQNAADSLEAIVIKAYEESNRHDQPMPSRLVTEGGVTHYFKPILLQGACLPCHGIPGEHIVPEVIAHLRERFPADRAFGFEEGDVRGVWHLVFRQ